MKINKEIYNREIIIYGFGKKQKDFQYMFPSLKIVSVVDKVTDYEALKANHYFIVICKDDEENAGRELESRGFRFGEDYCFATNLFKFLEPIQLPEEKSVYVWGTGHVATRLCQLNKKFDFFEAAGYIDSAVQPGTTELFYENKVWNPQDIDFNNDIFILVATTKYYEEIRDELLDIGLQEGIHFIKSELFGKAADMMYRTYFDLPEVGNQFICKNPFEYLQVDEGGAAYCCCPYFVNGTTIGNLEGEDFFEIWNSSIRKIFQLSILNGTFSFCNHELCVILDKGEKSKDAERKQYQYEPKRLKLFVCIDGTCNLYCTSCRNHIYVKTEKEVQAANSLVEKIQNEIIPRTTDLYLSANGEVFLSKVYRRILEEVTFVDHIGLLTNGTLFDKDFFEDIRKKCNSISVLVSVDAATQETYGKIRRGGNFSKLRDNLEYIGELRSKGIISYFILNYVVQFDNKDEIKQFAEWGKKLHVDKVDYSRIVNWGTYTEEEFTHISLFDRDGVILKQYETCFEGLEDFKEIVNFTNLGLSDDMSKGLYWDYEPRSPIL